MNKNNVPSARRPQEPDPNRQLSEFTASFVPYQFGGTLLMSAKCFSEHHKLCDSKIVPGDTFCMKGTCRCKCHTL